MKAAYVKTPRNEKPMNNFLKKKIKKIIDFVAKTNNLKNKIKVLQIIYF